MKNDNKSNPFVTDKRYYNDKLKMNNCNNDNHKNTNIDGGSTAAYTAYSAYESFSDVGEIGVYFASKILTPCRMH